MHIYHLSGRFSYLSTYLPLPKKLYKDCHNYMGQTISFLHAIKTIR